MTHVNAVSFLEVTAAKQNKRMNVEYLYIETFNLTCDSFCSSRLSGVKPGYREQAVASLSGAMAPPTQRVSSLFPPTVCRRTAPNCSVQPQSAAPR